jgi:hypothetical protein
MNNDEVFGTDESSEIDRFIRDIAHDYKSARAEAMSLVGDVTSLESIDAIAAAIIANAPTDGVENYVYYRKIYRFALMRDDRTGEVDIEQVMLLRDLDLLTKNASKFRQSDHYEIGFISTIAKMTHCITRTRGKSISEILALWLVPARVKACHGGLMTHDRIEYVLKLAIENNLPVRHFGG